MMKNKEYILGIDTSNYKTSAAITDAEGNMISDVRNLLEVKQGERGLRQSDALFQHIENLPEIIEKVTGELFSTDENGRIAGVAVSNAPRNTEGSYMPVFKAGMGVGRAVAASLGVPYMEFSHQEGHIEAIRHYSHLKGERRFLAYHLSGGTCELLRFTENSDTGATEIKIIGHSKDISFGQVIDRVGVLMGMAFPAGKEIDDIVLEQSQNKAIKSKILKPIPIDGLDINLSGLETQCSRALTKNGFDTAILKELFDKIADCLISLTKKACKDEGIDKVMFAGGVSSSRYISQVLKDYFCGQDVEIVFGDPGLSQDNAVGIALLGGKCLWQ